MQDLFEFCVVLGIHMTLVLLWSVGNYGYLVSFYSHSSICWRNRKKRMKKNYCYRRLWDDATMGWIQFSKRISIRGDNSGILKLFCLSIRCTTCPLVFGCWELSHMMFPKLRKKELLAMLSKFTKWQLFSLKTTTQGHLE